MDEVLDLTCTKLMDAIDILKARLECEDFAEIPLSGPIGVELVDMLATVDAMNAQLDEHFAGADSEGG